MTEQTLPLDAMHRALGARMVPFAGYAMPVQFAGVMPEHLHTRSHASLFDVSHMGQVIVRGDGVAAALERAIPANLVGLAAGRQRYGLLTAEDGGVIDDLMAANRGDHWLVVVNGACKHGDLAHLRGLLPELSFDMVEDRALLALQGPQAEAALAALVPGAAAMRFMDVADHDWDGAALWIARAGYTGEDGYEISVPVAAAEALARALLSDDRVAPAGLGARDSLRMEAGLPLYGQDLSVEMSPVEAGQGWAVPKVRRRGGDRAGGFPGAERILRELEDGAPRRRVGLRPEGRAPMREGTPLFAAEDAASPVGTVTSGGFGPTVGGPIAMGVVDAAAPDRLWGEVRGRRLPATVADLPFVAPRYRR